MKEYPGSQAEIIELTPNESVNHLRSSVEIAQALSLTQLRAILIRCWYVCHEPDWLRLNFTAVKIHEAEIKIHETMKFHPKFLCSINQLLT